MALPFIKMHGLGNDFVIVDCRKIGSELTATDARFLSHRRKGVGCDQIIPLLPPLDKTADTYMRILNPDGSESGACGNATRCVADMIMREKNTNTAVIETKSGLLYCTRPADGMVTVDMGEPSLEWSKIPLSEPCDTAKMPLLYDHNALKISPICVNMGNPHVVFFVESDVGDLPVTEIGPKVENNPLFPEKTNVEFVQVLDRSRLRMRVWERGAGETQACGSGACAVAVAAVRLGVADRQTEIILDGGSLFIEWRETDNHVLMTGPVAYVFKGRTL